MNRWLLNHCSHTGSLNATRQKRTMMMNLRSKAAMLLLAASLAQDVMALVAQSPTTTKKTSKSPMFEYLKFDGNPTFDVLKKTKEYVGSQSFDMAQDIYDKDYVLRGPVIGPINRKDLKTSQTGLGLREAFPDVNIDTFGYTIDPENPYRCFYFQRWRATHTGDLDSYGDIFEATGIEAEMPVSVFSVVWTPEGKIIYEQVGAVVDRFEGNTAGKAAVFGLLRKFSFCLFVPLVSLDLYGLFTHYLKRYGWIEIGCESR